MAWPTSKNPKTEFVTLRLTPDEMADLNTYASTYGLSRSQAVRFAVEQMVSTYTPYATSEEMGDE